MPAPTLYLAVNALLSELLDGVRPILGSHFVGMMLFGSLAGGDFDEASDVDVLVVTDEDVSAEAFAALEALHARLAQAESPWAIQLEVSYIPLAALRRYDREHATHLHLDRGQDERLKWMLHDAAWVAQRHVLRERGVVLAGPAPESLIDPVSPNDLREAMRLVLRIWAAPMLDERRTFNSRGYQSYTVLSLCRILYTLEHGTVVTKAAAARWALERLDKRWTMLIERALAGRQTPQAEVLPEDVSGTADLIRYALLSPESEVP